MMDQEQKTLVFYPSLGMGHLGTMVELAKLIVTTHPSFSITILLNNLPNTPESSFDPLIASVAAVTPLITFLRLPPVKTEPSSSPFSFVELSFEIPRMSCPEVRRVLETMSRESNLKAVCIDFFCNPAYEVAESLGIPTYYFFVGGGCGLASLLSVPVVLRAAEASHDPNVPVDIPGLPPVTVSDFSKAWRLVPKLGELFTATSVNMCKSRGIISNTFRALEERTLGAISEGLVVKDGPTPPLYCVGPLVGVYAGASGEDEECLRWLDSQPSKSVVYLCFGSMGVFSSKQLKEMATGLESSGHRFLWVVRKPRDAELDLEELLPRGFMERTKGRGMVVKNWAPQEAILLHDSVGAYVTHCGWNSILEAICARVPMVARPLYAEQRINATALFKGMRLALKLNMSEEDGDGFVSAEELAKRVRELMDSESASGREVRERMGAMKEAAVKAMAEDGSSRLELAQLVGLWE